MLNGRDVLSPRGLRAGYYVVVGLLAAMGVGVLGYRLAEGMQVTSLTTSISWGMWVSAYIYFVGLSAGSFLLSTMIYVFGMKQFEKVGGSSIIIGRQHVDRGCKGMSLLRGGRYREGVNHRRALRLVPVVAGAVFVGLMALSCDAEGDGASISFQRTEASQPTSAFEPAKEAILFATAAVNSPEETFALYGELLGYLGDKLDRPVRLVQGKTYAEINELVRSGDVTLAIVCSAPYVLGHDQFGMEALVVPQVKGKTTYHSYIIASRDSPAKRFEDLRGRTFAFSDPMSNSGRLVPLYMLWQIRETPESFFGRYIFTYSHDNSIKAVATGLVDGAAVDSLVYDYAAERNPRYVQKTKVIHVSPPYGINPVVVNPRLDPELKSQIRSVLLGMNEDPEGQRILEGLMFDRFVPADDSAYDSIREMLATLNRGQAMPDLGGE